nr:MAG TPA: terminase large subunit [Herelleviridae sp.]
MSSSPFKIVRRWSTPTVRDYGIDKLYKQSDQWFYGYDCKHCGHFNEMKYKDYDPNNLENSGNVLLVNPDGIDEEAKTVQDGTYQYVCQKCGKPLDRWYSGRWESKFPSRTENNKGVRGYFISQLNATWISLDEIKEKEMRTESKQSFYNYIIGDSYEDVKLKVLPEDVYENKSPIAKQQMHTRGDYKYISVGKYMCPHKTLLNGETLSA